MLKVKKLHPDAKLPTVSHPGEDLAYDLYALEDTILDYGQVKRVRTGIAAQAYNVSLGGRVFPLGLLIRDRSSMAAKGIVSSGGVVDAGYTGEISVLMTNMKGSHTWEREPDVCVWGYKINVGDKIAQMIPITIRTGEVIEVKELRESSRGEDGFGSTGR